MNHVSCLFTPATKLACFKPEWLAHTRMVVIDLEDAIHPKDKEGARRLLKAFDYAMFRDAGIELGLRINQLDSIDGIKDIVLLDEIAKTGMPFSYLIVTKINNRAEMQVYRTLFDSIAENLGIMPIIETLDGVQNVNEIATLSCALLLGQADLKATMYAPNKSYLAYARSVICLAAARQNILAMDGNSFELADLDCLREECQAAKEEGFNAKAAIHPRQLSVINETFSTDESTLHSYVSMIASHDGAIDGFSIRDEVVIAPPFVKKAKKMLELSKRIKND